MDIRPPWENCQWRRENVPLKPIVSRSIRPHGPLYLRLLRMMLRLQVTPAATHKDAMNSLRLLGKYVIPHFLEKEKIPSCRSTVQRRQIADSWEWCCQPYSAHHVRRFSRSGDQASPGGKRVRRLPGESGSSGQSGARFGPIAAGVAQYSVENTSVVSGLVEARPPDVVQDARRLE